MPYEPTPDEKRVIADLGDIEPMIFASMHIDFVRRYAIEQGHHHDPQD